MGTSARLRSRRVGRAEVNTLILAAGATLLGIGLVCLATLPFLEQSWIGLAQQAVVLGFLGVGIVVAGFVAFPLAKAEAKVRECQGCKEETE